MDRCASTRIHPLIFNLYRLWGNEEDLSFRQLVYQAKVRTRGTESPVLLLMQARITSIPGGEMPVIGRDTAISGENDWTTMEVAAGNGGGTRFLGATLQLQMDGPGTVWIDDIKLLSRQFY